jgi:hypothetical protein
MSADEEDTADLETRLNNETAVISWSELVKHFARGVVINVGVQIDLLDAAACLVSDDTQLLQSWLDSEKLNRATDDNARDWTVREPEFWCVVTAPWVLVQEKTNSDSPTVH